MRLLITGAGGMLGINLCLQQAPHHTITALTLNTPLRGVEFDSYPIDITDYPRLLNLLEKVRPDAIVHCAAMAEVDGCENQPEKARMVNCEAPGRLAEWCSKQSVRLVHISTDAVFDGVKGNYIEADTPNPLSVYAQTKLDAERNVAAVHPQAIIARVNFYGFSPSGKRSLAEFFLNSLRSGSTVHGFDDVYFCPLYVGHLAETIMAMLERELFGLFHVVSPGMLTKFEFGRKIANQFHLSADLIKPISVKESGLIAQRPENLTLRIDKLINALGTTPADVNAGIDALYQAEQNGLPKIIKEIAG